MKPHLEPDEAIVRRVDELLAACSPMTAAQREQAVRLLSRPRLDSARTKRPSVRTA